MFKPMDPDQVRKLLEGHDDIIGPDAKAEEALYRHTSCPMCGGGDCEKRIRDAKIVTDEEGQPVVAQSPFGSGILPEGYAHCINCGTDFNPYTGMIFTTEASIIHGPESGSPPV